MFRHTQMPSWCPERSGGTKLARAAPRALWTKMRLQETVWHRSIAEGAKQLTRQPSTPQPNARHQGDRRWVSRPSATCSATTRPTLRNARSQRVLSKSARHPFRQPFIPCSCEGDHLRTAASRRAAKPPSSRSKSPATASNYFYGKPMQMLAVQITEYRRLEGVTQSYLPFGGGGTFS